MLFSLTCRVAHLLLGRVKSLQLWVVKVNCLSCRWVGRVSRVWRRVPLVVPRSVGKVARSVVVVRRGALVWAIVLGTVVSMVLCIRNPSSRLL